MAARVFIHHLIKIREYGENGRHYKFLKTIRESSYNYKMNFINQACHSEVKKGKIFCTTFCTTNNNDLVNI